jgi:hypothetical protein
MILGYTNKVYRRTQKLFCMTPQFLNAYIEENKNKKTHVNNYNSYTHGCDLQ